MSIKLDENDLGDEVYSLIFKSLKHPIRRKILRMLNQKSLTFSEILKNLSIDSAHLSYHIESLGILLLKSEGGGVLLIWNRRSFSKANGWC